MEKIIDFFRSFLSCPKQREQLLKTIDEQNRQIAALGEQLEEAQKPKKKNYPKRKGLIFYNTLMELITKQCGIKPYLSDSVYSLTDTDEAQKFSIETKIWINKWLQEQYDCDEFSFALMGYWNEDLYQFAFGIAWSRTHAFNIMVDHNKKIWIVEPQTNQFIPLEKAKKNKMYFPLKLVLI